MVHNLPLQGVRVVDFGWIIAGPFCTKILAALGAEVLKIEGRPRPDTMRRWPPFLNDQDGGLEHSATFNNLNVGKSGLCINVRHPKGVELVMQLVAASDVVIENFSVGTMDRFGLGYETLRQSRPDIIMISLSSQGATGPHRGYVSYGPVIQALSGLTSLGGYSDGEPVGVGGAVADYIAGLQAAVAVVAALNYRRRTGKGQFVDLSQFEATASILGPAILSAAVNGPAQYRNGNAVPYAAPHGVYPCMGEERWVAIAVRSDAEWKGLCQCMGRPQLVGEPRFSTLARRLSHREELDDFIAPWTRTQDREALVARLQASGIPSAPVNDARDLFETDPQFRKRRFYQTVDHPSGQFCVETVPIRLTNAAVRPPTPAPTLGQHTAAVLQGILGMAEAEIAALADEGVL